MSDTNKNLGEEIKLAIQSAGKKTEKRKAYFNLYFDFTLESDQWFNAESNELKSKEVDILTFNHSEDYFEKYISRLFPRNPLSGAMDIGVNVIEENKELRSKYDQKILDEYEKNNLTGVLLEQGQNFLIGGAGCLYYPPNAFGGVDIVSLDPKFIFLGWKLGQLDWFAFYDEDIKQYTFINKKLIVNLDENYDVIDTETNTAGFIPFSWIPNMPKAHSKEGRTKIASLFSLDRAYNKTMTNFNKRIDENTDPHRAIYSDTVKENKISRGKGKTTVLAKGDKIENLELKEGSEILDYANSIEESIRSKTALVDSGGAIKSGISGVSLSFQFSDMLDKIAFMRVHWDRAFKEMNNAILNYAFKKGSYVTKPVYNQSINYDESQKVIDIGLQVEKNLMSRRDAIDSLRGGSDADEKLQEIVDEKLAFPDLDSSVSSDNKLNNKEE